jgi:DNA topoisomerase IV subunit A (EC 5.99.1.3)
LLPRVIDVAAEAFIEREPLTIILSEKGWVRALKGHAVADADLKFKEGDRLKFLLRCSSVDRVAVFASNGRIYTIRAADLPRGRGDGQAIRLMIELGNDDDIVTLFVADPAARYLVANTQGRGFIVSGAELAAEKRTGKQILTTKPGEDAKLCLPLMGDHLAIIGQNRKLLVFPLDQIPEMARGAGVILQKYKDGGLADAKGFTLAEGLTWKLGDKIRTEPKLTEWLGARGQAGRLPPNGFPRSGVFGSSDGAG